MVEALTAKPAGDFTASSADLKAAGVPMTPRGRRYQLMEGRTSIRVGETPRTGEIHRIAVTVWVSGPVAGDSAPFARRCRGVTYARMRNRRL